jgi:hypothetical protein
VLGLTSETVSKKARALGLPEPDGPGVAMRDPPAEWIALVRILDPPFPALAPPANPVGLFPVQTITTNATPPPDPLQTTNWYLPQGKTLKS